MVHTSQHPSSAHCISDKGQGADGTCSAPVSSRSVWVAFKMVTAELALVGGQPEFTALETKNSVWIFCCLSGNGTRLIVHCSIVRITLHSGVLILLSYSSSAHCRVLKAPCFCRACLGHLEIVQPFRKPRSYCRVQKLCSRRRTYKNCCKICWSCGLQKSNIAEVENCNKI